MVGMMAGLKGKVKLLDVVVPFSVYYQAAGTAAQGIVYEPDSGNLDFALHQWVHTLVVHF